MPVIFTIYNQMTFRLYRSRIRRLWSYFNNPAMANTVDKAWIRGSHDWLYIGVIKPLFSDMRRTASDLYLEIMPHQLSHSDLLYNLVKDLQFFGEEDDFNSWVTIKEFVRYPVEAYETWDEKHYATYLGDDRVIHSYKRFHWVAKNIPGVIVPATNRVPFCGSYKNVRRARASGWKGHLIATDFVIT